MTLFSFSDMQQFQQPVRCHATGKNSLLISFFNVLHDFSLLRQAISLTWIVVGTIFDIDFLSMQHVYP